MAENSRSEQVRDVLAERLQALGMVIEWSATVEEILRSAFCSLVGSKYAAVVAAGQSTGWLIGQCRKLTKVHLEITAESKTAIMAALSLCEAADKRRNTLVHGVKTASNAVDGSLLTVRSRRGSHEPVIEPWTPGTIREAAGALAMAGNELFAAVQSAVSPDVMVMDQALAWEYRRREQSPPSPLPGQT